LYEGMNAGLSMEAKMRRAVELFVHCGIWLMAVMIVVGLTGPSEAGELVLTVQAGTYRIVEQAGAHLIEMEDSGYLAEPGKPMLPARNFLVALPPGARVSSVNVQGINAQQLPGAYWVKPSPEILPLVEPDLYRGPMEKSRREWQENNRTVYSSDDAYPNVRGKLKSAGTLRKYSYASVSFYPFEYHPLSRRLVYYSSATISISYSLPSPGSMEADRVEKLKSDTVADQRAARLFINYDQMSELYRTIDSPAEDELNIYDYVIITDAGLQDAISSSAFLDWKASLGYSTRIVLMTDDEIRSQPGADWAQKIRYFLMENYGSWGTEFVLLVGDYSTIPMRYCYPDSNNHANGAGDPSAWPWSGDVPTDCYYADLSNTDDFSWDSDRDGFCGEYGQDNPDFLPEVYVGRIPTNNTARITYTLDKLVAFERDTGDWKNRALHAGAIAFFGNEDHSGREVIDGAELIDRIETDVMSEWAISHYSEQGGLGHSSYRWSGLSEAAFLGDWRNGQYGVVNWYAHGWSDRVARKVWSWDDGDGVPESNEMWWPDMISINSSLDDDYPSIVFALSCMVGYPEPNDWGNLGIDLLTEPGFGASAGVVSGTRVVWVSGGEEQCYEFNRFLIGGPEGPERTGEALYDAKFYMDQNYDWNHYCEYWDLFTYNLYGDPSLNLRGDSVVVGIEDLPTGSPNSFLLSQNYPNPFNASTSIGYQLSEACRVSIDIYDLLGRRVTTLVGDEQAAGYHKVVWDAPDEASGLYIYRMRAGDHFETRRMLLLK
jgi:hypothetical protein